MIFNMRSTPGSEVGSSMIFASARSVLFNFVVCLAILGGLTPLHARQADAQPSPAAKATQPKASRPGAKTPQKARFLGRRHIRRRQFNSVRSGIFRLARSGGREHRCARYDCRVLRLSVPFLPPGQSRARRRDQKHPGKVHLVLKNLPLSIHPDSLPAHEAALAAAEQGKFWEMHDLLFANQKKVKMPDLLGYARQLHSRRSEISTEG